MNPFWELFHCKFCLNSCRKIEFEKLEEEASDDELDIQLEEYQSFIPSYGSLVEKKEKKKNNIVSMLIRCKNESAAVAESIQVIEY